jgi:RNA polymerase sigma factor (sigma-70 family)
MERSVATASTLGGAEKAAKLDGAGEAPPSRSGSWHQRYGRLYEELWRPARTMVRRAFGRAFSESEIEDLYGNAWLGTLRALERRRDELSDGELRKYVLTAVANQASKELRRRGRRPTAPLDLARGVADAAALPDERAAGREESQIAREVLGTLPARRRAVMLLRYGWGLEPREVCGLIKGLSHRAYRKEITRGVDEISAKLRLVEEGRWCGDREPILKAYAAGLADDEERRQAEHHLAHCRHCAEFVGKLQGHLHEVGGSVAWAGVADAVAGDQVSLGDRIGEAAERARDFAVGVFTRSGGEPTETVAQAGAAGGARGAGVGAAGGLAKLAGVGAVPKLVAACIGTGAAATACVATGLAPMHLPTITERAEVEHAPAERPAHHGASSRPLTLPSQVGHEVEAPAPGPRPAPPPETVDTPIEPEPAPAPPVQQEFGLAPAGAAGSGSASLGAGGAGASSGGEDSGAVTQEFGP